MFSRNKTKGFSLVEVLIVILVIGLLLTFLVMALNLKQKEIRDIKRLSDVQIFRNALEVVKNETGAYDRAYCDLGVVSQCARSGNSELNRYVLNLGQMNDPSTTSNVCQNKAVCEKDVCNYTLIQLEEGEDEILFHLEKGADNYKQKGCYRATPFGIFKM